LASCDHTRKNIKSGVIVASDSFHPENLDLTMMAMPNQMAGGADAAKSV
jgi:hypothetical protein